METDASARAGRRAALKTLPLALLFAGLLVLLLVGPEGFLIITGFGLLGLPGVLFLAWYLGGMGGIRILRNGGDATVTGFLVSAGSLLGASLSGSALYAIFHIARFQEVHGMDIMNQFMGPLYFLCMFGLPVCAILGMIIAWFMRREAGMERVPFRPWRTLLMAVAAFTAGPACAMLLWQLTLALR